MLAGKGCGTARPSVPLRQSEALRCLGGRAPTRAPFAVNAPRGSRPRRGARPARRPGKARMLLPRCPAWVAEAREGGGGRGGACRGRKVVLTSASGLPSHPRRAAETRASSRGRGTGRAAMRPALSAAPDATQAAPASRAARVPALPLRVLEGGPRVFLGTQICPGTVLLI